VGWWLGCDEKDLLDRGPRQQPGAPLSGRLATPPERFQLVMGLDRIAICHVASGQLANGMFSLWPLARCNIAVLLALEVGVVDYASSILGLPSSPAAANAAKMVGWLQS
jgi:hypothetical protein